MPNPESNEEDMYFLDVKLFKTVSPIIVLKENIEQFNKIYQFKPPTDKSLIGCVKCGKHRRYIFNALNLVNLEKHLD